MFIVVSLRGLLHLLTNIGLHAFATKVTLEDGAVGAKEHDLRNALDAVKLGSIVLVATGNANLGICDTLFLQGFLELFLLISYVYAQYHELLTTELLLQLNKVRNLALAGTAP